MVWTLWDPSTAIQRNWIRLWHKRWYETSKAKKNSESFNGYVEALTSISDKLRIPINEGEFVDIVIRNLKAEIRHELLHLDINDISTLKKESRKHKTSINNTEDFSVMANKEINTLESSNLKCWNCDEIGHRHQYCFAPRRRFCYRWGILNTYRPSCPKCLSKSENCRPDVRQNIGGYSIKQRYYQISLPEKS